MSCDLCKTNSGRTNANLRCCQVRGIAQLPEGHRRSLYAEKLKEIGVEEVNKLIEEVNIERRRLRKMTSDRLNVSGRLAEIREVLSRKPALQS